MFSDKPAFLTASRSKLIVSVENRPKLAASEVCIMGEVREQSFIAK